MEVQFAKRNSSYAAVPLSASIYIGFVVSHLTNLCYVCVDINRLRTERSALFNDTVNGQDYLASVVDE
jgi:hypothetical protein